MLTVNEFFSAVHSSTHLWIEVLDHPRVVARLGHRAHGDARIGRDGAGLPSIDPVGTLPRSSVLPVLADTRKTD